MSSTQKYIQGDVMQESYTLNENYMLFAPFRILKSNFKGMKTKNSDLWHHDSLLYRSQFSVRLPTAYLSTMKLKMW